MRFAIGMRAVTVAVLGSGLAACSSSSANLFTGSTKSEGATTAAATPPPAKPSDRTLQVAATSARASRCGYNFDPGRLRTSYIASEQQSGLPPAEIATLEKLYDVTRDRVAKSITDSEAFCSDEQTTVIKRDLTRHMAGDFTPVRSASSSVGDWFSGGAKKPWNPEDAFYPNQSRK